MEISSQVKTIRPKIIWTGACSIVKMLPREVTIFPEIFFSNFGFKYYKSMPNIKICLNEVQTLEQSHQIR